MPWYIVFLQMERNRLNSTFLACTERKLDVHKTFRRCPGRLLNVPAGNYMFEVNNRNIRPRSKVYSQLAIETYSKPCSTMAQVDSCKFPKFLKAPEHEYIFSGIFWACYTKNNFPIIFSKYKKRNFLTSIEI